MASELDGVIVRNEGNERALRDLARVLCDEQPLLLVGAGSSFRVDYPMWAPLLDELEAHILERRLQPEDDVRLLREADDDLWRAEQYRQILGEDGFARFIHDRFGPRDPTHTGFHERLLALPWRHVLTTNYDPTLEPAHASVLGDAPELVVWNDSRAVSELVARSHEPAYGRRYVYVHGRYDREGIILTEGDYQYRYLRHRDDAERLFTLLDSHVLVSVGFSFSDYDLLSVFRRKVAECKVRARHFALLGDPGRNLDIQRRVYCDKYGVEPVYYPLNRDAPAREKHRALDRVVDWLHANVCR